MFFIFIGRHARRSQKGKKRVCERAWKRPRAHRAISSLSAAGSLLLSWVTKQCRKGILPFSLVNYVQWDRGKCWNTFSRPLGHSRQQKTINDNLQKTDTYRPITRPVIVQPYLRTLTRRAQLLCDSPNSLQDKIYYLNVFNKSYYNTDFVRRNTHCNTDSNTQTNVNSSPVTTVTIYRTSEVSLELSYVYYNLTIYVLHTNR